MSKLKFNFLVWRGYRVIRASPFSDADFGTDYTDVYLKKGWKIAKVVLSGRWTMADFDPPEAHPNV